MERLVEWYATDAFWGRSDCYAIFSPIGFFNLNEILFKRPIGTGSGCNGKAWLSVMLRMLFVYPYGTGAAIATQFFLP